MALGTNSLFVQLYLAKGTEKVLQLFIFAPSNQALTYG
jgi:hypothetical protein